ncbi:hypothetical protein C8R47DRAFT_1067806 [Mycena vitilis]|nr:hypothetical protein C8R47DRAFT_1067806 [Mycena vitilis]
MACLRFRLWRFVRELFGIRTVIPVPSDMDHMSVGEDRAASPLPLFPATFVVHYLTTEVAVNCALKGIVNGVVGFDTEYVPRRLTQEETLLSDAADAVGGSKKSVVAAWQVLEARTHRVFPYAWDTMGLCTVQISRGDVVWVINLRVMNAYPSELRRILTSPDIVKVGVGVASDVGVVWSDLRSELKCLVDCGLMARLALTATVKYRDRGFQNLSMEDSAVQILGFRLDKEEQVSDWAGPLTDAQVCYAGTDAVVALRLYEVLVGNGRSGAMKCLGLLRIVLGFLGTNFKATFHEWLEAVQKAFPGSFDSFLSAPRTDFVSFVRARNRLLSVNRRMRSLVASTVGFWTRIVLTQHVSFEAIQMWIRCSDKADIEVEIMFQGLRTYYQHGNSSARICAYARRVLPYLLPTSGRWSHFKMHVEDDVCAALLALNLRGRPRHRLVSLDVAFCLSDAVRSATVDLPGSLPRLPLQLFLPAAPSLVRMSLSVDVIVTADLRGLCCLAFLEIRAGCQGFVVRLCDLVTVLRGVTALRHLVLHDLEIDVNQRPPHLQSKIVLPTLELMELHLRVNAGMGSLVGRMELPHLVRVELVLEDAAWQPLWMCLTGGESVFAGASSLVLRTSYLGRGRWDGPRSPFVFFPGVVELNLVDAESSILGALATLSKADERADFPLGMLLPRLEVLSLAAGHIQYAGDFVDSRMTVVGACLKRLHVHVTDMDDMGRFYARAQHVCRCVPTFPIYVSSTRPRSRFSAVESERAAQRLFYMGTETVST